MLSCLRVRVPLAALALTLAASAAAQTPSAADLLKDADRARGAAEDGVSWEIDVQTVEDGTTSDVHYLVKVKGDDALAEATAPARNKGEMMLFNDRNLWFFKPGLKKPVSISARQKLMGQAANGDIASTNYLRDYDGKVVGEETVDGKPAYKLELKAKAKNVTYDGIRYWISKDQRVGVKAEFLTVGGEMYKTATFEYNNTMQAAKPGSPRDGVARGGADYPFVSKMVIVDALKPANKTTLDYQSPKAESHADSIFNVNNMVR
jgi:outer membrane lipoprotein-sorting protein